MKCAFLGILAASLTLVSCSQPRTAMTPRRCVDNSGRIIEDRYCQADERDWDYGSNGYVYHHHWYYGGEPGFLPVGRPIFGGSYVRPNFGDFYQPKMGMEPGRVVMSTDPIITTGGTTVTRGVFGGTARAFAGGHSGGGGE